MPGRQISAGNSYRYGFNGKESDGEIKGDGNQQDYGMRIYDPRLGRFLSVDPLAAEFAWNSPYSYSEGDPINFIDLDGAEKNATKATAPKRVTKPILGNTLVDRNGRLIPGPVGPSNPGPVPPYGGARRVGNGWYIETPNGGFFRADKKRPVPMTPQQREENRRKIEDYEIRQAINNKIWSEKPTSITANLERFEDPSTLPDEYLAEVEKRIKAGTASMQDYQYQDEIARRKRHSNPESQLNQKITFSKLSENEIRQLQEKFGDGDPDFIEKLKKPGGKGAGGVDLYKNNSTGEIVVIPKAQKDKSQGGETTNYNIKDLDR